jgi:hypothetical protein
MGPRFHLPAVRYDYQAKDELRHRLGPDNSVWNQRRVGSLTRLMAAT